MLLDYVEGGGDSGGAEIQVGCEELAISPFGDGAAVSRPPVIVRTYRASLRTNNPPPTSRTPVPSPRSVA
jgi:hypothetical protein